MSPGAGELEMRKIKSPNSQRLTLEASKTHQIGRALVPAETTLRSDKTMLRNDMYMEFQMWAD